MKRAILIIALLAVLFTLAAWTEQHAPSTFLSSPIASVERRPTPDPTWIWGYVERW